MGAYLGFASGAMLLQLQEVLLCGFTGVQKVSEAPIPHISAFSTHQVSALLVHLLRQPLSLVQPVI